MLFSKRRKISNKKNSRKISKRNQLGGADLIYCVYIAFNNYYYPVLLTENVSMKNKYLHDLKIKYIDDEDAELGEFMSDGIRLAEITRNTDDTVSYKITDVNWNRYDEDIDVTEQEDKFYKVNRDYDGLIYRIMNSQFSYKSYNREELCSENPDCFKDGEEIKWQIGSAIQDMEYFIQHKRYYRRHK